MSEPHWKKRRQEAMERKRNPSFYSKAWVISAGMGLRSQSKWLLDNNNHMNERALLKRWVFYLSCYLNDLEQYVYFGPARSGDT